MRNRNSSKFEGSNRMRINYIYVILPVTLSFLQCIYPSEEACQDDIRDLNTCIGYGSCVVGEMSYAIFPQKICLQTGYCSFPKGVQASESEIRSSNLKSHCSVKVGDLFRLDDGTIMKSLEDKDETPTCGEPTLIHATDFYESVRLKYSDVYPVGTCFQSIQFQAEIAKISISGDSSIACSKIADDYFVTYFSGASTPFSLLLTYFLLLLILVFNVFRF